jgi:hypothetical protein
VGAPFHPHALAILASESQWPIWMLRVALIPMNFRCWLRKYIVWSRSFRLAPAVRASISSAIATMASGEKRRVNVLFVPQSVVLFIVFFMSSSLDLAVNGGTFGGDAPPSQIEISEKKPSALFINEGVFCDENIMRRSDRMCDLSWSHSNNLIGALRPITSAIVATAFNEPGLFDIIYV